MKFFLFFFLIFSLNASSIVFETKLPIKDCFKKNDMTEELNILKNIERGIFPNQLLLKQLSKKKAESQSFFISCILKKKLSIKQKKNLKSKLNLI